MHMQNKVTISNCRGTENREQSGALHRSPPTGSSPAPWATGDRNLSFGGGSGPLIVKTHHLFLDLRLHGAGLGMSCWGGSLGSHAC